jgi:hypothetical protein
MQKGRPGPLLLLAVEVREPLAAPRRRPERVTVYRFFETRSRKRVKPGLHALPPQSDLPGRDACSAEAF